MAKGKKGKKSGLNLKIGVVIENTTPQNNGDSAAEENKIVLLDTASEAEENPVIETIDSYYASSDDSSQQEKIEVSKDDTGVLESENLAENTVFAATAKSTDLQSHLGASKEANFVAENSESSKFAQEEHLGDEEFGNEIIAKKNDPENDDEDDDFGSFDEASFEEFEPAIISSSEPQSLPMETMPHSNITPAKIVRTLDFLFPDPFTEEPNTPDSLLSEKAATHYGELSRKPRLQPPNWTKLKLRHNLLLKLGVPINLDELVISSKAGSAKHDAPRKKLISESDLDWSNFNIPDIDSLNLTQEAQQELLEKTTDILSRIETENMNNTSELYLQKSLDEDLESKLSQLKSNHDQLLLLGSLWHERIEDLKGSQNVFESVVQSMVGYNQKIQRKELLESLSRTKTKRGKKTF